MWARPISVIALLLLPPAAAFADSATPWGRSELTETDYAPHKVVYDISVGSVAALELALDRASYLSKVYGADPFAASIVMVLHGDEINYFAIENIDKHRELMRRAQSLTVGGIIQFHMCTLAAKAHGYEPEEIHGFVEMVPMADAEIVRLQTEEGYAYMQ